MLQVKDGALKPGEHDLSNSKAQIEQVLAQSPAVIYRLKLEGERLVPVTVSDGVTALLGFTPEEATSPDWWLERPHPDDRKQVLAKVAELLRTNASRAEYRVGRKEGGFILVEDNRRLFREVCSELAEVVGLWTDITARKNAEAAAAERLSLAHLSAEVGAVLIQKPPWTKCLRLAPRRW